MATFISTATIKYLTCDTDKNPVPIYAVTSDELEDWLDTLSVSQARWVKENHFKAKKNQVIKLAGKEGELTAIAIGVSAKQAPSGIAGFAKLARSLPEGHYKFIDNGNDHLSIIGWAMAQYKFDRYQKKKSPYKAVLVLEDEKQLREISSIINGITLIRDLINTPACDMGPSHLSDVMKDLSEQFDARFSEVVGDDLLCKGLNTIHTVGKAALEQPRLLEMNWGREEAAKLTLVGKGVCFDTGGLDLKSSTGMRLMKKDMGGAAHVLGIAQMIMQAGLDVRLRLLIPAVENNISADAFRPGDIIRTYKGTTVEVGNTDAEGRLVLCDALALATEENPDLLINFATLTGAAKVAMGNDIVPFFTDNEQLAKELAECAVREDDPLWRLPLYTPYEGQLTSTTADLCNIGSGPYGGAIIAALFLKHFVDNSEKWLHFDMFAWNLSDKATCPEGGEAMAVRAVFAYLKTRFG